MKLKLPFKDNLVKATGLLGISLLGFTAGAQTNVTVDANDTWVGAMIVYDNTPEQPYLWYSDWGIADVKTEVDVTNNSLRLYPNYNVYAPGDAYWVNGDGSGAKIMLGISLVIDDALVGQNFTFSGTVSSHTLAAGYEAKAFAKVLTADWAQLVEITTDLDETGNFTVGLDASQYPDGAHVQYGFMVRGVNANPANMAANGFIEVTSGEPIIVEPGENIVTLDPTTTEEIIAYANWFELDGTTYLAGSVWGLADLRTDVDTNNNTFILYPNFSAYGNGADPYWANGEIGNKIFEGNTYVEDNDLLGQSVTFNGYCISNTLADGYDGIAFIKVLSNDYQLLNYTTADLVTDQSFSITVDVADFPAAAHVQYGYSVTGLNANPNQMATLGNAVVAGEAMSTTQFAKQAAVVYPNPATDVLNIAAEGTVENVTVYNMMGQAVMQAKTAVLNVSALNSGMYVVRATINGTESTVRFVKK